MCPRDIPFARPPRCHHRFPTRPYRIGALGHSSKLNAEWDFLTMLRDEGRACAERFLRDHADAIGKPSTPDLDEFLQGV